MPEIIAAYGTWESPFTAQRLAQAGVVLSQPQLDGHDLYWLEMRPNEEGRCAIVRHGPSGSSEDVLPPPWSARTLVHEYGGGAYTAAGGSVFFSNAADQLVYAAHLGDSPVRIAGNDGLRFADFEYDPRRRFLYCVCEDHRATGSEPSNRIVAIDTEQDSRIVPVDGGADFVSSPRLSPNGEQLAWLRWHHPNMPWDASELWLATLRDDGTIAESRCVAGGGQESITQPKFSPDGRLYFVSDRSGWWNLYRMAGDQPTGYAATPSVEALAPMAAEFATPHWIFALSSYAFLSPTRLVSAYQRNGRARLAILDTRQQQHQFRPLDLEYEEIHYVQASPGRIVFCGGSPTLPMSLVEVDPRTMHTTARTTGSDSPAGHHGVLSTPEAMEFQAPSGERSHAFFYPPRNDAYAAPANTRPPLLVVSHGGPTAATSTTLNLGVQFWTSRGFAVLDVNYRGSSGYGRAYRRALDGLWGVADVLDCVNGALALVRAGRVDPERLAIRGSSAGGYTTLCALTFHDVFHAGASYYGISDLEALARDTHKFEARYLDRLVGPYPERQDLYRERSPIHSIDRLSCPVVCFQGGLDKAVPPSQAESIVSALRRKGMRADLVVFPDEAHGFRRAENIVRAREVELAFYTRVLRLGPPQPIPAPLPTSASLGSREP